MSKIGRPKKKKSELKAQKTIRVSKEGEALLKKNGHTPQTFFDLHLEKLRGATS